MTALVVLAIAAGSIVGVWAAIAWRKASRVIDQSRREEDR